MCKRYILYALLVTVFGGCRQDGGQLKPPMGNKDRYSWHHSDSLIEIDKVHNYCDIKKPFTLSKDGVFEVSACGEIFIGEKSNKRDVFEMYFDLFGSRKKTFTSENDRFFFFSEIGGSSAGLACSFKDVGKHRYDIEIAIPWNKLSNVQQGGRPLGFDFALTDNDNGFEQEKQVAWHSLDSDIWLDETLWGKLILSHSAGHPSDSEVISLYTREKPKMDGTMESCWNGASSYKTEHVLWGKRRNEKDNIDVMGVLRSLWDRENLYFFVEVYDDKIVKQAYSGRVFDYGWIEDSSGNPIWQMNRDNSVFAGGAHKNYRADTTLSLKKGDYYLCYKSDESHAFGEWDDDPPKTPFYGIRLRKIK